MTLLQPGMELLNKLSFSKKFHLILATFVIPILYAGFVIYSDKSAEVKAGEEETRGYSVIKKLQPLRLMADRHRSLKAQYLNGVTSAQGELASLESQIDQQKLKAAKAIQSLGYSEYVLKAWKKAEGHWADVKNTGDSAGATESSFQIHTEWIVEVGDVIELIATESGLVLDSYLDSYTLMELVVFTLPRLDEHIGQLIGRGVAVSARGEFTPDSYVGMTTIYDTLALAQEELSHEYDVFADSHKELVAPIKRPVEDTLQAVSQFLKTTKDQILDPDQPQLTASGYDQIGVKTQAQLAKLAERSSQLFEGLVNEHRASSQSSMMLALTLFTVLLMVSAYLLTALKRTVDDNAHLVQTMAKDLKGGKLNGKYSSQSQDELGETVHSLVGAYKQLRDVVGEVREQSNLLTGSSEQLQDVSSQVNKLGESQKDRVGVIVTASSQLAATASDVASHCEHAATETQSTQEKATQGAKRSESSAGTIRQLAESIREAGDEIGDLAQQAASISTVIDVIKEIAEQTNLLALNAAIEAARAGEQGRGFAVVADEVRTLANRTQESTEEIESTISSLQQVAEQAVSAMNEACEKANTGEEEAMQTGEMLRDIVQSVTQVSGLIKQVATASDQQAKSAGEISQNIQQVDGSATDLVAQASEVSEIASQVKDGSHELQGKVKGFQV